MKKRAVKSLTLVTILLTVYILFFFLYNFNYINSLNDYFSILSENNKMIGAVNANRAVMNEQFTTIDLILGGIGAVLVLFEIIAIKNIISLYKDLAYKDPMTGAFNRASLNEVYDNIEDKKRPLTLTYFLFDMNYMKQLNDGYGHKWGDLYLIAMTKCIQNAFGKEAKVYRLGGDEFSVLYMGNKDAKYFVERIDNEVEEWNKTKEIDIPLSFAKGYFSTEWDYSNPKFRDSLYTRADNEMYEEKEAFHKLHPRDEKVERKVNIE